MGHRDRVLIVDDDQDTLDALRFSIEALGCEARTAASGADALAIASAWRPTAALLDIGLPEMDGYELAGEIRRLDPAPLLLVALTGYGTAEDRDRAFAAGFDSHLVKGSPSMLDDLRRLFAG